MRQEVNQPDRAPRPLVVGDRRAHRGVIGRDVGEEAAQPGLRLEQARALGLRLREHRVQERPHFRRLVGGEAQRPLQFQHVQRPRVAVLVGRERQAEPSAVSDHLLELGLTRLGDLMAARRAPVVRVLGPRQRRDEPNRGERHEHGSHSGTSFGV